MKTEWASQLTPEGSVPLEKRNPTMQEYLSAGKQILDYIVLFFMKFTEILDKELGETK